MVKVHQVCRPTRDVLRRVAAGRLKNVKLDMTAPIMPPSTLPTSLHLPITLQEAWQEFQNLYQLKSWNNTINNKWGRRRLHGSTTWNYLVLDDAEVTSTPEICGRDATKLPLLCYPVSFSNFFNIAENVKRIAGDMAADHDLVTEVTNSVSNDKFEVLAELYLLYRPLLYAYFKIKSCSGGIRHRWKKNKNIVRRPVVLNLAKDTITSMVITIYKPFLCKACCADLLDQVITDDVVTVCLCPNGQISITADRQRVDKDVVSHYKHEMVEYLQQHTIE